LNHTPFLFVRNKLVGRIAALTGSPHHLSNSSSEGSSAEISNAKIIQHKTHVIMITTVCT